MRAERSLPLGGKKSVLASARSTDGGATWSSMTVYNAQMTGPCHALRLHNGEVLLSYKGYDNAVKICAAIVDAECITIDTVQHTAIRRGHIGNEAGSVSAVQLTTDAVLVVYHNFNGTGGARYIAGTYCDLVVT